MLSLGSGVVDQSGQHSETPLLRREGGERWRREEWKRENKGGKEEKDWTAQEGRQESGGTNRKSSGVFIFTFDWQ